MWENKKKLTSNRATATARNISTTSRELNRYLATLLDPGTTFLPTVFCCWAESSVSVVTITGVTAAVTGSTSFLTFTDSSTSSGRLLLDETSWVFGVLAQIGFKSGSAVWVESFASISLVVFSLGSLWRISD